MTAKKRPLPSPSTLCHQTIAALAGLECPPDTNAVMEAVHRRIGSRQSQPSQVLAQSLSAAVANYFRHYAPGDGWRLEGRGVSATSDRVDLTWIDGSGDVVVDVVLASANPTRREIAAAARGLRDRAVALHSDDVLLALRVVVPRTPERSCLVSRRSIADGFSAA